MARGGQGQARNVADRCSLAWAARPGGGRADYRSSRHFGQAQELRSQLATNTPLDTSSDTETSCRPTA